MESAEESIDVDEVHSEKDYQFRCTECKKRFQTDKALILHMRAHNAERSGKNGELYVCNICGKTAKTRQALDRHAAYHQDDRPFPCEKCHQRFKNSDDRGKHYRRLKRDGKFEHACTVCHKHFKSNELLKKHQVMLGCLSHTEDEDKSSKQDTALPDVPELDLQEKDEVLKSPDSQEADSSCESKPLICRCKMCEMDFTSAELLKSHYRDYHNDSKRQVCIQCGQTLSSRDSLNRHYNIFHQNDFPYACRQCDQKFKIKESLIRHIKFVHSDGGYVCKICNHVFSLPVDLKKHMLLHSASKNLTCTKCGRHFRWKQELEEHLLNPCDLNGRNVNMGDKNGNSHGLASHTPDLRGLEKYGTDRNDTKQNDLNVQYGKSLDSFDAMDIILSNSEKGPIESHKTVPCLQLKSPRDLQAVEINSEKETKERDKIWEEIKDSNLHGDKGFTPTDVNDKEGSCKKANLTDKILSIFKNTEFLKTKDLAVNSNLKQQSVVKLDQQRDIYTGSTIKKNDVHFLSTKTKQQFESSDDSSSQSSNVYLTKSYPIHSDNVNYDFNVQPQVSENNKCSGVVIQHKSQDKVATKSAEIMRATDSEICKETESVVDAVDNMEDSRSDNSDSQNGNGSIKVLGHESDSKKNTSATGSQDRNINNQEDKRSLHNTQKLKTSFKPSNLPLIMAPLHKSSKHKKLAGALDVTDIKEMVHSVDTDTTHHRHQKNPFIMNVCSKIETDVSGVVCPSQGDADGQVLDLTVSHSSKQSPTEKPPGKFSLIKHMLSLQNEDHFDKRLFDNPFYNKPADINDDIRKLAEMHRISNDMNGEEYDLSCKQNIPIHWLGLSRQSNVDRQSAPINYKQSGCDVTVSSSAKMDTNEKVGVKRTLIEETQNVKVRKTDYDLGDDIGNCQPIQGAMDDGCNVAIEKESVVNSRSASQRHENQDSLNPRFPITTKSCAISYSMKLKSDIPHTLTSTVSVTPSTVTSVQAIRSRHVAGKSNKMFISRSGSMSSVQSSNIGEGLRKNRNTLEESYASGENRKTGEFKCVENASFELSKNILATKYGIHKIHRSISENHLMNDGSRVSMQTNMMKTENPTDLQFRATNDAQDGNASNMNPRSLQSYQQQNSSAISRTFTSPQTDVLDVRMNQLKQIHSKHFERNSFSENSNLPKRLVSESDCIEMLRSSELSPADQSEVYLAKSLDIDDVNEVQMVSRCKQSDFPSLYRSISMPSANAESQLHSSNQGSVCSKSKFVDMSFVNRSFHDRVQHNIFESDFHSAIYTSDSANKQSKFENKHSSNISNIHPSTLDGYMSKTRTSYIQGDPRIFENGDHPLNMRDLTKDTNHFNRTKNRQEFLSHPSNYLQRRSTIASLPNGIVSFENVGINSSSTEQSGVSVLDMLQLPGGSNRLNNHQHVEHFLRHCLD